MKLGTALIISLLAIVALVAELILYFVLGLGAALAGGTQAVSEIALLFVGLMIVTGTLGVLAPICAVVELLAKKLNLGYYLLLPALGLVGIGYVGLALLGHVASQRVPTSSGDGTTSPPASRSGQRLAPSAKAPETNAYLSKVIVRNISVGKSVLDKLGVWGEVKNTGDRSLDKVEITIFFLNREGRRIHEKTYHPVLVSEFSFGDSNGPLKPGYAQKFGVKADDAPSEWANKVEIEVTDVRFSK